MFLPGGGSDILDDTGEALTKFGENAIKLVNLAEKINKKGEYFPIWGTCLGYEIILMAFSGNISILESYNSSSHNGKLDFLKVLSNDFI